MPQLCVPVTDLLRRNAAELLPLIAAVSYKGPAAEVFDGKFAMLDTDLNIADPRFRERMGQAALLDFMDEHGIISFACDLGPNCLECDLDYSANGFPRFVPKSKAMSPDEFLDLASSNVRWLRDRFGGAIKVENLSYFATGAYELVCEPEFIRRAIETLQVELLLDLGHLKISANNLCVGLDQYVATLPLHEVSEVHVSGSGPVGGIWEDLHGLPSSQDYALLDKITASSTVRYITLEYYGADEALVAEYRKLWNRFVPRSRGFIAQDKHGG